MTRSIDLHGSRSKIFLIAMIAGVMLLATAVQAQNKKQSLTVRKGQNVQAKCTLEATGGGKITYSWEKPLGTVISTDRTLVLEDVDVNNMGSYYCRASIIDSTGKERQEINLLDVNVVGSDGNTNSGTDGSNNAAQSASIEFQPPVPNNRLVVNEGEPIYRTCRVNPQNMQPMYTIQWISDRNVPLNPGSTLYIPRVSSSQSGRFTCVARDQRTGAEIKETFELMVMGSGGGNTGGGNTGGGNTGGGNTGGGNTGNVGAFGVTINSDPIVPSVGRPLTITCETSPNNLPGVQWQWFMNGQPVSAQGGTYYIPLVRDVEVAASYECRATVNGMTRTGTLSMNFQRYNKGELSLQRDPDFPKIKLDLGRKLELHCETNDIRSPSGSRVRGRDVTWYFEGRELTTSYAATMNAERIDNMFVSILTLRNAQINNQGLYECRYQGDIKKAYIVMIGAEASIEVNPSRQTTNVGGDAELHCRVANLPGVVNSNVRWYFLGPSEPVNTAQSNRRPIDNAWRRSDRPQTQESSFITLNSNAQAFHTGYYLCEEPNGRTDYGYVLVEDTACDPIEMKCETNAGRPPAATVFSAHWKCDGEDDCGNGFDESNCRISGTQCGGTQFQCPPYANTPNRPGNLIPNAFVCDGERDCWDGKDEQNCLNAPLITRVGNYETVAIEGTTVTLTCSARAKPLPTVIWRWNWRCLPDFSRMTVENSPQGFGADCMEVRSTLTIRNFRSSDVGIYNCEALSASKRAISQDYQVRLNIRP
jgi:hypothetical protein